MVGGTVQSSALRGYLISVQMQVVCWWSDLSYKMYAGPGWLVNVEPPEMHHNICYKENLYFCTWKELEHNRR